MIIFCAHLVTRRVVARFQQHDIWMVQAPHDLQLAILLRRNVGLKSGLPHSETRVECEVQDKCMPDERAHLESPILQHLFDGHNLACLLVMGLKDHTKRAVADNLFRLIQVPLTISRCTTRVSRQPRRGVCTLSAFALPLVFSWSSNPGRKQLNQSLPIRRDQPVQAPASGRRSLREIRQCQLWHT